MRGFIEVQAFDGTICEKYDDATTSWEKVSKETGPWRKLIRVSEITALGDAQLFDLREIVPVPKRAKSFVAMKQGIVTFCVEEVDELVQKIELMREGKLV